jgi:hypothetical protein
MLNVVGAIVSHDPARSPRPWCLTRERVPALARQPCIFTPTSALGQPQQAFALIVIVADAGVDFRAHLGGDHRLLKGPDLIHGVFHGGPPQLRTHTREHRGFAEVQPPADRQPARHHHHVGTVSGATDMTGSIGHHNFATVLPGWPLDQLQVQANPSRCATIIETSAAIT